MLPATAKIHNLFHVCLLRPGPLPSSPLQLPYEIHDNQPVLEPTAIIDWKWDSSSTDLPILVLVQWHDMPLKEASCEPWSQFKDQFHLEDKVLFELGGDVRIGNPISLTNTMNSVGVTTYAIEETPQDSAEVPTREGRPQRASRLPPTIF